jgi:signal transduction histidine kinase
VVAAAVDAVAEAYNAKGVALLTRIPTPLPALPMDPDRMGQVLGNLLDNAMRHTPAGGTVTISVVPSAGGGGTSLAVADTGDGISAEHLPHVFERFYRVDAARDRAHGGSGIGLAIAKALVEAHGGQLTAQSPGAGRGTTFRIGLPNP